MQSERQVICANVYDVDTEEAPVGADVLRWPDTAGSGSSSPDYIFYINRSSISFKPKEPTSSSFVVGRALQTDDRLVPTSPKEGARAGQRQAFIDLDFFPSNGAINAKVVFCGLDLIFKVKYFKC